MQEEQAYYLNQICSQNALYVQQSGKRKKCLIHTFGCQMNERDSEILFGFLTQMGYEKTEKECVVNMLPNSQEKIRFAVQMEEDEDDFMEDAIHNEMCIAFNMKLLGEDNNCSEKLMIINISNDLKEFPVGEYSIDSINS